MELTVQIGDHIMYVDEHGDTFDGLVTQVWGKEHYEGDPPAINLVMVEGDPDKQDPYGRQIRRPTSIPHKSHQSAPGVYWFEAA